MSRRFNKEDLDDDINKRIYKLQKAIKNRLIEI